jgi:RHS repeat-associated protein
MVGYLYDAEGNRIGKGSIQQWNCNSDTNGFSLTNEYVLGQSGEQVTELDGNGGWLHTNACAGGQMIATYDTQGLHYQISDWLGNRRVQTNSTGAVELTWQNLPFGELTPSSTLGATEHHFTGKERDAESGNDYFGARYYSSAVGRWTSPDPSPNGVSFGNPQSWNLYAYVLNNPLRLIDNNGMWATDVHAQIVTYALQDYVSAGELNELRARQYAMDADQSNQNPHAMGNPGTNGGAPQSSADALNSMWQYVAGQMGIAQNNSGQLSQAGLDALGNAMHTLEDWTSPMHTDPNFMPMTWTGGWGSASQLVAGFEHVSGESTPDQNWGRIGLAVRLTMAAYLQSGASCEKGKSCLTEANFESEFNKNVTNYVDNFYSTPGSPGFQRGYGTDEEESARLCALGNPAACDH